MSKLVSIIFLFCVLSCSSDRNVVDRIIKSYDERLDTNELIFQSLTDLDTYRLNNYSELKYKIDSVFNDELYESIYVSFYVNEDLVRTVSKFHKPVPYLIQKNKVDGTVLLHCDKVTFNYPFIY